VGAKSSATIVAKLTDNKFKLLHESYARFAIEHRQGGSSNHTYVDAEGKKGSYMSFANVFRREGQPCPRCGTPS